MAARINLVVLVAIVAVAAVLPVSTSVTIHTVGDNLGWQVPSGGSSDYANWAAQQNFTVGDILVFNFITGQHSAAKVTKAAFDSCNTGNTISSQTNGPANYTLDSAGEQYFFCTFTDHCSRGQKLQINVTASGSGSPQSSPPPPPGTPTTPSGGSVTPPPPPPSSAPPAAFSAFCFLFMSFVFAFL